jgi:hypothetical protein
MSQSNFWYFNNSSYFSKCSVPFVHYIIILSDVSWRCLQVGGLWVLPQRQSAEKPAADENDKV